MITFLIIILSPISMHCSYSIALKQFYSIPSDLLRLIKIYRKKWGVRGKRDKRPKFLIFSSSPILMGFFFFL
jgi:hypothetical protein